ncbi:MAG: ABC transporter ATP-binding protein, partial [Burkholderiales bacterium]|nr:ABC transporter ATP-binding protein [Burkholderiales bacterium]
YGESVAVDGLDLVVAPGRFFGLLGPNGSGKTTTLQMLATLLRPSGGHARVAGFDTVRDPIEVRRRIGFVFQESALDRTLTVAENLRFAGMLHGLSASETRRRWTSLLDLFDMGDRRDTPVAALSGGQRRALDIIRGVLHEPAVLLLDEPTIGLDLPIRRRIWRFIETLRVRNAMSVVLTTHYLEEADPCDQVAFIRRGKLVSTGAPADLVAALGQRIVEFETDRAEAVVAAVGDALGTPPVRDGRTLLYRVATDDSAALAALQDRVGAAATATRVRRPNLGDVFLWVHAGEAAT